MYITSTVTTPPVSSLFDPPGPPGPPGPPVRVGSPRCR